MNGSRETHSKSADYLLNLSHVRLVVEVKQIEPNPEERQLLATPCEEWDGELVYHRGIPGERIRKKIAEAVPELRVISNGVLPTLLVIYDTIGIWPELTDADAVRAAMFGVETALIGNGAAPDGGATVLDRWCGGRKRLTRDHNTTLSAIGILEGGADCLSMKLFHNPYAQNRLPDGVLDIAGVQQYCISGDPATGFPDWVQMPSLGI